MKLVRRAVEKPWGRTGLPAAFGAPDRRIGEIWFEAPDGRPLPLLVKLLFTSEKLSVQVHPDDRAARARGLPNGKSECWYVLNAEPDAALGLGFREELARERLRGAALDGSIEALLDWKPAVPDDVFYVPAGTVHAIGGGLSLVEVQQQSDVTYRLYDYGRPRELHLDDGIAVAALGRYPDTLKTHWAGTAVETLVESPYFRLLRVAGGADPLPQSARFLLPLHGTIGGASFGDCLFLASGEACSAPADAAFLLAVPRPDREGDRA